jgi:uncharacterized protein (DUF58 family)
VTRRGRSVLALGLVVYLAAWAFGSRPLYPVAAGLLLVSALAWAWVRAADRPMRVERRSPARDHVEGDDVEQRIVVEPSGRLPPPTAALAESVGRLGDRRYVLRRQGRRLLVDYRLERLRRGRYPFMNSRIEIADPFGLQRRDVALPPPGALLVYPRIVPLDRLFSETGAHALDGRQLLLRRPTGFDLHSVRDYEHGESLRMVHWRTTARRGRLMVKELEDAPRDEIAVLLDGHHAAVAGESFDMQVRAAASLLEAYVRRRRRAVLVLNVAERVSQQVHSPAADRRRALELLAAVDPTARAPLTALLAEESSPAARALEVVVVTARIDRALTDRLVQRALSRRRVSLVYVDAPTFVGASPTTEPLLLRLTGCGVPVAVLRAGDDLRSVLSGEAPIEAAALA